MGLAGLLHDRNEANEADADESPTVSGMSETKRPRDAEWLAEFPAEQLADEWADRTAAEFSAGDILDEGWARLLVPDAVMVQPADLRIDDAAMLVERLLDLAVHDWLTAERLGAHKLQGLDDPHGTDDAREGFGQTATGVEYRLGDDRRFYGVLWSMLVDCWRRGAPPFATIAH